MKAFRNFVIMLGLALFLVPLKNAYAITYTNTQMNDIIKSSVVYFKTVSTTNPNTMNLRTFNGQVDLYKYYSTEYAKDLWGAQNTSGSTVSMYLYESTDGGNTWNSSITNNIVNNDWGNMGAPNLWSISSTNKVVKNKTTNETIFNPITPATITVLLPLDATHKDTTDLINVLIQYQVGAGTLPSEVNIQVKAPTIPNYTNEILQHEYKTETGQGILKFSVGNVPVGTHEIEIDINGTTKKVTYQRLGGVVDENGDGVDDRTNLPVDNGHAPEVPDEDFIKNSITTLKAFTTEFQGFQVFITGFLGVFPPWITMPIATLFTVLVIMTIVKIIRG